MEINIEDVSLRPLQKVKLLGLNVDIGLNFDFHVSQICQKASWHINAVSRIAKYLNPRGLKSLFNSFILSNFTYCCQIWHFCSKENRLKIEKIQKRALRVILNDYESPYSKLLENANASSMHVRRLRVIAKDTFNIINGSAPRFLCDLVKIKEMRVLRDPSRAIQPKTRTIKFGLNSFRYEAAYIWNNLPAEYKACEDFAQFQRNIEIWSGPPCNCRYCILCVISRL